MLSASLPILISCSATLRVSAVGPMSQLFATWEDLAASQGVHDVSWSELQTRCEPGAGPHQAQGGWIADGTPIKDVLRKDWQTVEALGTSHLELAAHLDAIWSSANPCDFKNPKKEIDYDPSSLPQNTLASTGPVHLHLSCMHTRGVQEDLLKSGGFFDGWNTQWVLSDASTKLEIGGRNSSMGLVQYIKLFGFYEGGAKNEFRVDPERLVALLSGKQQGITLL